MQKKEIVKEYYTDGSLRGVTHFVNDRMHGERALWYASGQQFLQTSFENGAEHGVRKIWHEDGTPSVLTPYEKGKKHGIEKEYYPDGKPRQETSYLRGRLDGLCKCWDESGVESAAYFEKGEAVSESKRSKAMNRFIKNFPQNEKGHQAPGCSLKVVKTVKSGKQAPAVS